MSGEYFKSFIEKNFGAIFSRSNVPHLKTFLQDGDPSQNAKICKLAMEKMGIVMFTIPPRSPDLNPIENIFNNVKEKLAKEAIEQNIRKETFEEFCARTERTLWNYDKQIIDNTIESMNQRINLIIKGDGKRLKY